jgi:RNA polymerase sigma-70 factor (ECF subfamily)
VTDPEQLLERLRQGDEEAFRQLVAERHAGLVGVAMGFVESRATAEEVVQDTWLAVIEGLGRFEGRSSLKTWIYSIMANKARSRAVRDKRMVPLDIGDRDDGDSVDPARFNASGRWSNPPALIEDITPERVVAGQQMWAHARDAIDKLPARQRTVVLMRDVESIDAAEVAEIVGVSEANQRVLLHRGRARIRQYLEDLSSG